MSLSAEQWHNAVLIFRVGRSMGMSSRDIQIGLITAMQESSLRNLGGGDRDSAGLFQQRPSQGWGTFAQVTDPVYASKKFFSTLRGLGNRRYDMSMTEAAQAVQRSAYPGAYAKHIGLVRSMWPSIQSRAGASIFDMDQRPYGTTAQSTGGGGHHQPLDVLPGGATTGTPQSTSMPGNGLGAVSELESAPTPGTGVGAVNTDALAANYGQPVPAQAASLVDTTGNGPEPWATPIGQGTNQMMEQSARLPFQKGVDGWRRAVVQAARGALGTPYVWGGNSLQNGVDCSGLVQQAFRVAGRNMPRISYQQANSGHRVSLNSLSPGDLVAWNNSTRNNGADHIAIYIGNGQIIEAPKPGLSVRIRKLGHNEGAWGVHL